jgi:hypothetical protein
MAAGDVNVGFTPICRGVTLPAPLGIQPREAAVGADPECTVLSKRQREDVIVRQAAAG